MQIKKENKRGCQLTCIPLGMQSKHSAAHLEMIISFLLFFSFVSFLLLYIQPYQTGTVLIDSILLGLDDSFEAETSINLTKIFLKTNPIEGIDCFSVDLRWIDAYGYSLVKDALTGDKVLSTFASPIINIGSSLNAFYIFISDEFKEEDMPCSSPYDLKYELDEYTIGSVDKRVLISDKKLQDLKDQYEEDYNTLKQKFGVPVTIDFGISSGDYIVLEQHIPGDIEVIAKVFSHNVLFEDGSIVNKEFILKIW